MTIHDLPALPSQDALRELGVLVWRAMTTGTPVAVDLVRPDALERMTFVISSSQLSYASAAHVVHVSKEGV